MDDENVLRLMAGLDGQIEALLAITALLMEREFRGKPDSEVNEFIAATRARLSALDSASWPEDQAEYFARTFEVATSAVARIERTVRQLRQRSDA